MYQAMQFLKADIKQGLLVLLVYITISKTNRQLRSFARFGLTKLRNSIPAEIRQYPKMPWKKNMFMTMLSLLQTDDVYFEVPIILKRIKKPSENCKSLWPFSRCHILF